MPLSPPRRSEGSVALLINNDTNMFRKPWCTSPSLTEQVCIVSPMSETDTDSAKSGRPRSPELDRVVLGAVLDLIGAGASLGSLSLIGIAQHTGVSRNAIYRRWKSKEDLYVEVLTTLEHGVPVLSAQSARDNLISLMNTLAVRVADPRVARMERAIYAEAGRFPNLHQSFANEYVAPILDAMRSTIRRGKETGEIRVDVNEDILAYLLISSNLSPMFLEMNGAVKFDLVSQQIADLVFDGVAPK